METILKNIYIIGVLTALLIIGIIKPAETKIENRYIQQPPTEIKEVQLGQGWKCDEPKMTTDLLQPSGYWIGDTISCWKLEIPIKQYIVEECARTGDDYWCKDD